MPIGPYFMYVGGVLLVLLFAADAYLQDPTAALTRKPQLSEKLHIRIRSDHKWPEKVVLEPSPPAIAAAVRSQDDLAAKHANTSPLVRCPQRFPEQAPHQSKTPSPTSPTSPTP